MRVSYRMSAVLNGISGGNELKTLTIYNVSRDLVIGCNENNLSYYLKNTNYQLTKGRNE